MANKPGSIDDEKVSCTICHKEIPLTEAVIPEAADYMAHFCGLECYDQWKKKSDRAAKQAGTPKNNR